MTDLAATLRAVADDRRADSYGRHAIGWDSPTNPRLETIYGHWNRNRHNYSGAGRHHS